MRRSTCTCQAGYYFVDAKDGLPAECIKCDEICKYVCRGPATQSEVGGKIVSQPNQDCPAVSPDASLAGDIESEEEKDATKAIGTIQGKIENEANKRHRFYLLGQPCYSYIFDDLYFYLPTPFAIYRVKQDYSMIKYPARESRIIMLDDWKWWYVSQIYSSCVPLYQTGILYGGQWALEIRDIEGQFRPLKSTSVLQFFPWHYQAEWLAIGEMFNLVTYMRKSNLVIAASPQLRYLIVYKISFDPQWYQYVWEYLVTDYLPLKLFEYDGVHALVFWADAPYRSLLRASYQGSRLINYPKAQNVLGRDMSFDYNKIPLEPEADPRIAILFGENKIEILKSLTFEQESLIYIPEWSDQTRDDSVLGTVLFVPNSGYLVAAKMGERTIVFKKYAQNLQTSEKNILTVFDQINQILIPDRHKQLVVFDQENDLIVYYSLSKLIGCPSDKNIRSCGPTFISENIECDENFFWNPVNKKCECVADFFFDTEKQRCEKCSCRGISTQCFSSAESCNEEPYFKISLKEKHNVVDSACITKGTSGSTQLMVWDGQYGAQYKVDLRKRNIELYKSYTLPSMSPEQGKTHIECQWDFFVTSNKLNNFYGAPTSPWYSDHERFLFISQGLIDVVHTRNQFFPWMIFSGSSVGNEEESIPEVVFMQHNEEGDERFMSIDIEYLFLPYPHLEYYRTQEPVSAMTTLFFWGKPPVFRWVENKDKNTITHDFLVCAPNSKDS